MTGRCFLTGLPDAALDAVVAYGAALSSAFERRDRALAECIRVLEPRGALIIDSLSLWGTMHRQRQPAHRRLALEFNDGGPVWP